jgi:hypothetical protein
MHHYLQSPIFCRRQTKVLADAKPHIMQQSYYFDALLEEQGNLASTAETMASCGRMFYVSVGLGLWLLYLTWGGVVPDSRAVWGKSEVGQRMRLGQRILFGVGGVLFLGLAALIRLLQ